MCFFDGNIAQHTSTKTKRALTDEIRALFVYLLSKPRNIRYYLAPVLVHNPEQALVEEAAGDTLIKQAAELAADQGQAHQGVLDARLRLQGAHPAVQIKLIWVCLTRHTTGKPAGKS